MRLIRGLLNLKSSRKLQYEECIVTIGNYDGIHLGHQEILRQMVARGKILNLKTLVITFLPRPREYFGKCSDAKRLMTLREKIVRLSQLGIDELLILKFDAEMANMEPEDFVTDILIKKIHVRELFIGEDFNFGKGRKGDCNLLQKLAVKYDFKVNVINAATDLGVKISSSNLRKYIEALDLAKIRSLLGRNFSIIGRVVHGNKIGITLGFPTANINLCRRMMFAPGIYIVRVHCLGANPYNGVANVGFRPTIGDQKYLLEFHLFDFNENIYGKVVEVEFLQKIRKEAKFANLELLKQQIARDVIEAKKFFNS